MERVRHYTRISAMEKIVAEQRMVARDRNRIFVENAQHRRLSPADAVERYGLDPGKGNAYVEFDIEPERLLRQFNRQTRLIELSIIGDIDLEGRNAVAMFNF